MLQPYIVRFSILSHPICSSIGFVVQGRARAAEVSIPASCQASEDAEHGRIARLSQIRNITRKRGVTDERLVREGAPVWGDRTPFFQRQLGRRDAETCSRAIEQLGVRN
ncbi:MAG TPA: hypothetical protein VMA37_14180 [Acetobacteraceae bacterium]|nr:hypothetical protein [Acetobacteraceae bacterium]